MGLSKSDDMPFCPSPSRACAMVDVPARHSVDQGTRTLMMFPDDSSNFTNAGRGRVGCGIVFVRGSLRSNGSHEADGQLERELASGNVDVEQKTQDSSNARIKQLNLLHHRGF